MGIRETFAIKKVTTFIDNKSTERANDFRIQEEKEIPANFVGEVSIVIADYHISSRYLIVL